MIIPITVFIIRIRATLMRSKSPMEVIYSNTDHIIEPKPTTAAILYTAGSKTSVKLAYRAGSEGGEARERSLGGCIEMFDDELDKPPDCS